jgi:hypothetical protein
MSRSSPAKTKPVSRTLRKGATLLTRLSTHGIDQLAAVTRHYRVKQENGLILIREKNNYSALSTPLRTVNQRLSIDLIEQITAIARERERSKTPNRKIIVLDWGAGKGTALQEILEQLKKNDLRHIRLIGFGHMPFKGWHDLPKGIDMILDVDWALPLYFKKGTVDLIYSHQGLNKMDPKYYKMLCTLLRRDGGKLIMDLDMRETHTPDGTIKNYPVYCFRKIAGKLFVTKQNILPGTP